MCKRVRVCGCVSVESLESPTSMIARLLVLPPNHRAVWPSDDYIYHPDDHSSCVYVLCIYIKCVHVYIGECVLCCDPHVKFVV